jgi:hypothetical protein
MHPKILVLFLASVSLAVMSQPRPAFAIVDCWYSEIECPKGMECRWDDVGALHRCVEVDESTTQAKSCHHAAWHELTADQYCTDLMVLLDMAQQAKGHLELVKEALALERYFGSAKECAKLVRPLWRAMHAEDETNAILQQAVKVAEEAAQTVDATIVAVDEDIALIEEDTALLLRTAEFARRPPTASSESKECVRLRSASEQSCKKAAEFAISAPAPAAKVQAERCTTAERIFRARCMK